MRPPETYDGKGTFAAAGDKIKSAKGDVGITNDGNKTNYTLSNGELGIELFGQTIEVKGVTYKDGKIEADAAKLKLNLTNPITGEDNITASGTIVNPSVDEAGFKFVSAHLATSDIVLPRWFEIYSPLKLMRPPKPMMAKEHLLRQVTK